MISTMPYCGACGYDTKENVNDDVLCDSCGEDLTLHGFVKPAPPTVPPAADESPCDRMPATSATKPILITFLEEEWGHDDDAVSHMTKAELWALIGTHCD